MAHIDMKVTSLTLEFLFMRDKHKFRVLGLNKHMVLTRV